MYIINKTANRIEKIESTTFRQLGFKEREHLPIIEAEEFVISMANKSREEVGTQEQKRKSHTVRRKFWTAHPKEINKAKFLYQNISPSNDHWISALSSISSAKFSNVVTGDYIQIDPSIHGKTQEENKAILDSLESQNDKMKAAFGSPLERLSGKRMSQI